MSGAPDVIHIKLVRIKWIGYAKTDLDVKKITHFRDNRSHLKKLY